MSTAASIALILLIIEMTLGVFIVLAICAGMVFLMHKLRGVLKRALPQAQDFTLKVANVAHDVSNKVAEPFIRVNAATAQARATVDGARRRFSRM
jgi:gamma-glutamyl-gamma-aminobutyrate hydrolase PuuD